MKIHILVLATLFSTCAYTDEGPHHEQMTPEQLGTVHFPVSCASGVQNLFERGVALLHSFWYEEAEKQFEQVAKEDSSCAMAHWGVAMSLWHQLWNEPDAATLKRGREEVKKAKSLHPKSERERDYIAAAGAFYVKGKREHHARAEAYSKAMEQMHQRYADDREATAFYGLSLLASEPENDTSFATRKKAIAILDKLFSEEPSHPGIAHYLIHSCDKPQLAELGLPAARSYAKIASASPHALHMPSHIFGRLGLWQDDIDSNLASIAATRKTAAMHMGGASHQYHAMDFLVYAYLQSGREAEAQRVYEEVKAMSSPADTHQIGHDMHIYALAKFPAMYDAELHRWSEAAALSPVAGADEDEIAITYWARAIGAARSGNKAQARNDLSELESIHKKLVRKNKKYLADLIDQVRQEAAAWVAHAEGKDDQALSMLREVADKEDKLGEEPTAIPAREMLADLLLEMNRPEQGLAEYQADLKLNPNRFNGLYGAARAAELSGKGERRMDTTPSSSRHAMVPARIARNSAGRRRGSHRNSREAI
jgi:tetratricopeptide (TPR) repeat protein